MQKISPTYAKEITLPILGMATGSNLRAKSYDGKYTPLSRFQSLDLERIKTASIQTS